MSRRPRNHQPSMGWQMLFNFVIPLVILTRFSSESQLGPTVGFLVALSFPLGFELIAIAKYKKVNPVSIIAVVGIILTGGISLLGLSEGWLAVRRSAMYAVLGIALLLVQIIRPRLIRELVGKLLDMEKINQAATPAKIPQLNRSISVTAYAMAVVFLLGAIASYILTRVAIGSAVNTEAFNREYANLRVLTLPVISLPMIVSVVVVMGLFFRKIQKITGIEPDDMLKHKKGEDR